MLDAPDLAAAPVASSPSPDATPPAPKVSRYGEPRSAEWQVVVSSTWHGRHHSNVAKTATVLREPYRDDTGQMRVGVRHARGQTRYPLLASFLGDFAIDATQPPGVVPPSRPVVPGADAATAVVPDATLPNNEVLALAADVGREIARAARTHADLDAADLVRSLGRSATTVADFAYNLARTVPTRIAGLSKPLLARLYPHADASTVAIAAGVSTWGTATDAEPPASPADACASSVDEAPTAATPAESPQVFARVAGSVSADQADPAHLAELVATCLDAAGAATDARWVRGIGPTMPNRAALAKSLRQSLADDVLRLLTPACRSLLWPEEQTLTVGGVVATLIEDHAARHGSAGSKQAAAEAFASNQSMWTTYQRDPATQPDLEVVPHDDVNGKHLGAAFERLFPGRKMPPGTVMIKPKNYVDDASAPSFASGTPLTGTTAAIDNLLAEDEAASLLADITAGFTVAGLATVADAIATACHDAPNVDVVRVTTVRLANAQIRFLPREVQQRIYGMAQAPTAPRAAALPTYTFTLTGEVAVAFQRLLQARNEELAEEGASATAEGYHAKLIRDAARDKSLL